MSILGYFQLSRILPGAQAVAAPAVGQAEVGIIQAVTPISRIGYNAIYAGAGERPTTCLRTATLTNANGTAVPARTQTTNEYHQTAIIKLYNERIPLKLNVIKHNYSQYAAKQPLKPDIWFGINRHSFNNSSQL